jgi:protein-S-isoprenylcysteine O-methyltransferase Ste14
MDQAANRSDALPAWLRPAMLDRFEQVVVVVLFAFLTLRVFASPNPTAPLLLVSEASVAFFVLIRRPTGNISLRLGDWLLAFTATCGPLLFQPGADTHPALIYIGLPLVFAGMAWQIAAKLVLRRSFGVTPANRGVKISGPYRAMRHPIYAGYLATHVGLLMLMPSWFNAAIYAVSWWAQILRLQAEERFLLADPAYQDYAGRVRWRLVPGIY